MTIQTINLGAEANDGTGDGLRTGGEKINSNFQELDQRVAAAQTKADQVTAVADRVTSAEQSLINQAQDIIELESQATQVSTRVGTLESQIDDGKLPPGGTTGQVVGKLSDIEGDVGWINQTGGSGGGSTGLALPPFPNNRTMVLTKNLFGRLKTFSGGTDPITTNLVMELESPFMALQLGIPNISTAAQNGVKVSIGRLTAKTGAAWLVDINPSDGWTDLTFGGQATANLPARLDVDNPSWTWSDRFEYSSLDRTDGVRRPLIIIRIEFPVGVAGSAPYLGISNWRANSAIRYLSCGSQKVAGVTDKAAYTETLNTESNICVPAVKYYTERAGRQFLIGGDSTVEGIQGYPQCMGAAQLVAYSNSTPDSPIEYWNAAVHAAYPAVYSRYFRSMLDIVKPTHAIYSPYSVNEALPNVGLTEQAIRNLRNSLALNLEAIRNMRMSIKTVLLEGIPVTTAGKDLNVGDQTRRDYNVWINQFSGPSVATGYAAVVTGERVNGADQLAPEMASGDALHPDRDGYEAMANVLAPYLLN